MIRGIVEGGQAVWSDLLFAGHAQNRVHAKPVARVPHVVECRATLSAWTDFPGGVGWLGGAVSAQSPVSTVEVERRVHKAAVHLFARLGIKIPTHEQWNGFLLLCTQDGLHLLDKISTLGSTESLPAAPCFQMCHGDTEDTPCDLALQSSHHCHLVGLERHGRETQVMDMEQTEALATEEQGAAVRAVVATHIQAWRARLGTEAALVAQAGHHRLKSVVVVVHFLQTHNVWSVGQDLLQDQVLSLSPV